MGGGREGEEEEWGRAADHLVTKIVFIGFE
jgi:hypothetical protein